MEARGKGLRDRRLVEGGGEEGLERWVALAVIVIVMVIRCY